MTFPLSLSVTLTPTTKKREMFNKPHCLTISLFLFLCFFSFFFLLHLSISFFFLISITFLAFTCHLFFLLFSTLLSISLLLSLSLAFICLYISVYTPYTGILFHWHFAGLFFFSSPSFPLYPFSFLFFCFQVLVTKTNKQKYTKENKQTHTHTQRK